MNKQDWIKCEDRLPELSKGSLGSDKVLVAYGVKDKHITFGWYRMHEWVTSDMIPFARQELVTHWMPLVKP